MPFVDTFKLVSDDPPPRDFRLNAQVTVTYKPEYVPDPEIADDPRGPSFAPAGASSYLERDGLRFRDSHGFFQVDGELPTVLGFKPKTFKESVNAIKELDFFGVPYDHFRLSRLDLCHEVPGTRNEISESLSEIFKTAPAPHRARYDGSVYLARSSKMVQRFRIYNRSLKTGGTELDPAGLELQRFELQRRRPRVLKRLLHTDSLDGLTEDVLSYTMAKHLLPLVAMKTLNYDSLASARGCQVVGFLFLREALGERALKTALGKNTFYRLRKQAAEAPMAKSSPNQALRALRGVLAIVRPDMAKSTDTELLGALVSELGAELLDANEKNRKKTSRH